MVCFKYITANTLHKGDKEQQQQQQVLVKGNR
jgi:hypothetical protein